MICEEKSIFIQLTPFFFFNPQEMGRLGSSLATGFISVEGTPRHVLVAGAPTQGTCCWIHGCVSLQCFFFFKVCCSQQTEFYNHLPEMVLWSCHSYCFLSDTTSKFALITSVIQQAGTTLMYEMTDGTIADSTRPLLLSAFSGNRRFSRFGDDVHLRDLDGDGFGKIVIIFHLWRV